MSTPSKFAEELSRNITVGLNPIEMPLVAGVIDQALAPVRECLEGLANVRSGFQTAPLCWCGSMSEHHTDACLAAQQLMERLKIQ